MCVNSHRLFATLLPCVMLILLVSQPFSARAAIDDAPIGCPPQLDPQLPPPINCPHVATIEPQNFCLRLDAPRSGELQQYVVSIAAVGERGGDKLQVQLPFDPAAASLLDVRFSQPGAWLRSADAEGIVLELNSLERGGVVSATLSLQAHDPATPWPDPQLRALLDWQDDNGAAPLRSNRALPSSNQALSFAPASAAQPELLVASFDGFSAFEGVSYWYSGPDSRTSVAGSRVADSTGAAALMFSTASLAPGRYTMVARGSCSELTVTGTLNVP